MICKYSKVGSYHKNRYMENEDVISYGYLDKKVSVSIADGVTTCNMSKEGALIAAETATKIMLEYDESCFVNDCELFAEKILFSILSELKKCSADSNKDLLEYSSTLISVVYDFDVNKLFCLNIGDGVVLATGNDKVTILSENIAREQCVTTTTENALSEADIFLKNANNIKDIILMTDGAKKIIYNNEKAFEYIKKREYEKLKEFLTSIDGIDDCTFVVLPLRDNSEVIEIMERETLKPGTILSLNSTEDNNLDFKIINCLSEKGSSVICYEASLNGNFGILKEFYPATCFNWKHDNDNQLVCSDKFSLVDDRVAFYKNFKNSFRNERYIFKYIPQTELYYGSPKTGKGTLYTWTPNIPYKTFLELCNEIRDDPYGTPEYNLSLILRMIYSLTGCVCELHKKGFVHCDIKPENFGYTERIGETPANVRIFDIDSLIQVGEGTRFSYTRGFCEPEIKESGYKPINKTDIYSIGATLFYALVNPEDINIGENINRTYYRDIPKLINKSRIINASVATRDPELRNRLITILKKTLCLRSKRFKDCETLMSEIKSAHSIINTYLTVKTNFGDVGLDEFLQTGTKTLFNKCRKNTIETLQYHLYKYPLYECANGNDLKILISGFNSESYIFLDYVLEFGQIIGKELHVTVTDSSMNLEKTYLIERPELCRFFNINGKKAETFGLEDYGTIEFIKVDPVKYAENNGMNYNYNFISLGDNLKNCLLAEKLLEYNKSVNYIYDSAERAKLKKEKVHPICVQDNLKKDDEYGIVRKEIDRMAFNAHMVWEETRDLYKAKRNFEIPYNYKSSVSTVLAMKYKLYSIGIKLDDYNECAEQFRERINDNIELSNDLIWIEHKRWVTEKICDGWIVLPLDESIKIGKTKDIETKRHLCIVPSNRYPNESLPEDTKKWGELCNPDMLDALDRLSYDQHYLYLSEAMKLKESQVYGNPEQFLNMIETRLRHTKGIETEKFQKLKKRFLKMWKLDKTVTRDDYLLYKECEVMFLQEISSINDKFRVAEMYKLFTMDYSAIFRAYEYKNWKKIDGSIISMIPYILTFGSLKNI